MRLITGKAEGAHSISLAGCSRHVAVKCGHGQCHRIAAPQALFPPTEASKAEENNFCVAFIIIQWPLLGGKLKAMHVNGMVSYIMDWLAHWQLILLKGSVLDTLWRSTGLLYCQLLVQFLNLSFKDWTWGHGSATGSLMTSLLWGVHVRIGKGEY